MELRIHGERGMILHSHTQHSTPTTIWKIKGIQYFLQTRTYEHFCVCTEYFRKTYKTRISVLSRGRIEVIRPDSEEVRLWWGQFRPGSASVIIRIQVRRRLPLNPQIQKEEEKKYIYMLLGSVVEPEPVGAGKWDRLRLKWGVLIIAYENINSWFHSHFLAVLR